MPIVSVAMPGPWWTSLYYNCETVPSPGVRVRAPLGRLTKTTRVGVVVSEGEELAGIELKDITEVIDATPPLPEELTRTIQWFGQNWFLGYGMALKTLLPPKFMDGEALTALPPVDRRQAAGTEIKYLFEPLDEKRYATYTEMLEEASLGTLVLFPEVATAKSFWAKLPPRLKDKGLIWPDTRPKQQWELWQKVRLGEFSFVVGSASVSCLPFPDIRRIIVDDEASTAWRLQKHPEFHRRSLLAARARNAGAELVMGGRMPSAKVAVQDEKDPHANGGIGNRTIFVNAYVMRGYEAQDLKDKLPISQPLVRETRRVLEAGKFVLWILDRKGYAMEIFCDDCGSSIHCLECGMVMRWEEKKNRLYCSKCKNITEIPQICPSCQSGFLAGQRPGLDAIAARAEILFRSRGAVVLLDDDINSAELKNNYPEGALLVGTRKIIALADELEVSLVGWIDADGESRSMEYDSRARAFGLIWESAWRGIAPQERITVIQSRRPGQGWQSGLKTGWGSFWRNELKERKLLNLPPFSPLLKIKMPLGKGAEFTSKLVERDIDFWESDEKQDEVWVRTRRFENLRTILASYFDIAKQRTGMPAVTLYLD